MTYHVRLALTAAVFVLFVCGEKLLLNHKMNKPLPWYVVLSLNSPSASKLSSKFLICPRLRLGQMFTFRTAISHPRACITQYNIPRKWFIHKIFTLKTVENDERVPDKCGFFKSSNIYILVPRSIQRSRSV